MSLHYEIERLKARLSNTKDSMERSHIQSLIKCEPHIAGMVKVLQGENHSGASYGIAAIQLKQLVDAALTGITWQPVTTMEDMHFNSTKDFGEDSPAQSGVNSAVFLQDDGSMNYLDGIRFKAGTEQGFDPLWIAPPSKAIVALEKNVGTTRTLVPVEINSNVSIKLPFRTLTETVEVVARPIKSDIRQRFVDEYNATVEAAYFGEATVLYFWSISEREYAKYQRLLKTYMNENC